MNDESIRAEFSRDIWCLLGLVFDAVEIDEAIEKVRDAADARQRCFLSTPNLNFAISALNDPQFRHTVTDSDLNLLDGMHLLWVARLLGTGLTQKVSGSDLFERLWQNPRPESKRLRVFFFGGLDDVARRACERIGEKQGGFECAGYLDPGTGSVDELANQTFIDEINCSKADMLVVALGARKGQVWIDRNRARIEVAVVSHLGAVMNFVAGTVRRAPVWMQRSGLEWTWRIYEEPKLWRRYVFDGARFINLFLARVLPYAWWRRTHSGLCGTRKALSPRIEAGKESVSILPGGPCLHSTLEPLRRIFADIVSEDRHVTLDLAEVPVVDGAFLGLCILLRKHLNKSGRNLSFTEVNRDVRRIFRWNCVDYLL